MALTSVPGDGTGLASRKSPSHLATTATGWWLSQFFGFVFFAVVPVLWTLIAPVNFVEMKRDAAGEVTVTAKSCCLFVVPFSTRTLSPIVAVTTRHHPGRPRPRKRGDRGHRPVSESVDGLVFLRQQAGSGNHTAAGADRHGNSGEVKANVQADQRDEIADHAVADELEVAVSPVSVASRLAVAEEFLSGPELRSRRMFLVPNWKFSVIGGAIWTSLFVLYVVGVTLGTISWCWKSLSQAAKGPDRWEQELASLDAPPERH